MDSANKKRKGWVIWFVGLPGAGKSTYARAVYQALQSEFPDICYLSMDERRSIYISKPIYTSEERELAYKLFVEEAAVKAEQGINVVMDGTAFKLYMRKYARRLIADFMEIHIRCPLEIAIKRENKRESLTVANMYNKAMLRKQTGVEFEGLGEVIGIDVPFEEDPDAECVIDSDRVKVSEGRDIILSCIHRWAHCNLYQSGAAMH